MNVLFCPIYSMRSYETGKYSILKDGNFQLTAARILASDFDRVIVGVPEDSADFDDALNHFFRDDARVRFTKFKYGKNAVETREVFWQQNDVETIDACGDVVISDITGYSGKKPVVYNFNITKLPELNRPYIDKFFEQDLASIEQSLFTTVINPRQREYILEVRPDLLDKVLVNTLCAHGKLLPQHDVPAANPKVIFWPFRISDKAYQWEQFLDSFVAHNLDESGYRIVITDPNDTAKDLPPFVTRQRPTKDEYYRILSSRPTIVMLDDIDKVLHPGTIEFFEYGCPVITLRSLLIDNPNAINSLAELRSALACLNTQHLNMDRFVYESRRGGKMNDPFYNKDFINVRSS